VDGDVTVVHGEGGASEGGSESESNPGDITMDEINEYTNYDIVEKAFEECDLNHEGRLTYEEFKMYGYFPCVIIYSTHNAQSIICLLLCKIYS
jgi:hypothetical protein